VFADGRAPPKLRSRQQVGDLPVQDSQHFDAVLLAWGGHGVVRTTHRCDDMERMLRETPRVFPVSAVSLHV
jgi:hypothetical protein